MEPTFSKDEQAGFALLWNTYDSLYEHVSRELEQLIRKRPMFAELIDRIPEEVRKENAARSHERVRSALVDGNWTPLVEHLRSEGAAYANHGMRVRDWFSIVAAFRQVMVPYLVSRHERSHQQLTQSILGLGAYVDTAMVSVVEGYLERPEAN